MKTKQADPCKKFSIEITKAFDKYYHQRLSESIKRGILNKKRKYVLHDCRVKQCKV